MNPEVLELLPERFAAELLPRALEVEERAGALALARRTCETLDGIT